MEQSSNPSLTLQIDDVAGSHLYQTARWAKFLSIVGFIMSGLLILIGLFAGTFLAKMSTVSGSSSNSPVGANLGAFMGIIYVIIALLYFFPCLFLYRFSVKMIHSFYNNDQQQMSESLHNLRRCFKFVGIMTIVVLSIYALIIVGFLVGFALGR